jgi:transposase
MVSLLASGEYSTAEVADLFGVGRSTVYRAIERQRDHDVVIEIATSTTD